MPSGGTSLALLSTTTTNSYGLLPTPPGATTVTGPVVAPSGTSALISPTETSKTLALTSPPKYTTVSSESFGTKPLPLITTVSPTLPWAGSRPSTTGSSKSPVASPLDISPTEYFRSWRASSLVSLPFPMTFPPSPGMGWTSPR